MASCKRPTGAKPNDPFHAMFPENFIEKTIAFWLLRNLSLAETIKEEKPLSILEYFMSIDEKKFLSAIDRCPECTNYIIFEALKRRWRKEAVQLANAVIKENDLHINMLFECNLKNQPGLFGSRKLLRRKSVINFFEGNKVVKN